MGGEDEVATPEDEACDAGVGNDEASDKRAGKDGPIVEEWNEEGEMCEDEAGDREGGEDELATLQDKACEGGNDEACDERVGKDFVQATCKEIFFLGAFAVWKHAFYMSYLWLCLQEYR